MDCRPARRALVRLQPDHVRPARSQTSYPRHWQWRLILGQGLHQPSDEAAACPLSRRARTMPESRRFDVVGHDAERAIQRSDRLGIAPQTLITERDLLQSKKVARVQLDRALQVAQSFLLLAPPAQDIAGQFKDARIIRQSPARALQLGEGAVI